MEGYKDRNATRPDVGWWRDQLTAGKDFRDIRTYHSRWDVWRKYNRGEFKSHLQPKNLFFMMKRTIVPRTYFRNPSVSITPSRPGPMNAVLAKILERIDNRLINMMDMKNSLKDMVGTAHDFGTGIGHLGFGSEFAPSLDDGLIGPALDSAGFLVENKKGIIPNMPWFDSVPLDSYVVPVGTRRFRDAWFEAKWVERPVGQLTRDERFKFTKELGNTASSFSFEQTPQGEMYNPTPTIRLVEIHDHRTGKVMVLAPDHMDKTMFIGDDEMADYTGANFFQAVFNPDEEYCWGIPDSKQLEPLQIELNEIKTQIMKHRRLSLVKLLIKRNVLKEEEINKMTDEEVASAIYVDGDPVADIREFKIDIPRDLLQAEQNIMQDVREIIGFSRNQFGDFKPGSGDTTATEVQAVNQAAEIRIDERRDVMADVLVHAVRRIHKLVFRKWTAEQVAQIIGPAGIPLWVKFTGSMLQAGSYEVKIDPDTSVPETKQTREARAERLYALFVSNPLIDPMKLTTYMLHEHHGVAFDDMLRVPAMGNQQSPLNVNQAAGVFSDPSATLKGLTGGGSGAPLQLPVQ